MMHELIGALIILVIGIIWNFFIWFRDPTILKSEKEQDAFMIVMACVGAAAQGYAMMVNFL